MNDKIVELEEYNPETKILKILKKQPVSVAK